MKNIEDFAQVTRRVIAKNGFAGFLPTLWLPGRDHLAVLEGVPDDEQSEIRSISLNWAKDKSAGEQEFLLALREDENSFRIIRSMRGEITERVFEAFG